MGLNTPKYKAGDRVYFDDGKTVYPGPFTGRILYCLSIAATETKITYDYYVKWDQETATNTGPFFEEFLQPMPNYLEILKGLL